MSTSANIQPPCLDCAYDVSGLLGPFDYSHRYHLLATLGGLHFAGSYDDARVASAVLQAITALGAEASIGDVEGDVEGGGAAQPQQFNRTATAVSQRTGDEVL